MSVLSPVSIGDVTPACTRAWGLKAALAILRALFATTTSAAVCRKVGASCQLLACSLASARSTISSGFEILFTS